MNDVALSCHSCGAKRTLKPRDKIYREDVCIQCNADLHSCVHFKFFDSARNNQFSEPQAEWVKDKTRSNFCDYYEPRTSIDLVSRGGANQNLDSRAAFDNLFKK